MTTLAPPPAVTAYANAVRQRLAGLDAETLDELTGGLEADLAESLAERMPDDGAPADLAGVTSVFGSPELYADELVGAAGIEVPAAGATSHRPRMRESFLRARADALTLWAVLRERHGWLRWATDFLVSLRPAWWLLRGWVLFHLFTGMWKPVFGSGADKLLLLGLVGLSVLWGQGRIGQRRWWRRIGLLATAVAIIATLPVLVGMYNRVVLSGANPYGYEGSFDAGYSVGMNEGRQQAMDWYGGGSTALTGPANLFVYGPDGQPIENAQIVDQAGDPVVLTDPSSGASWAEWDGWSWDGGAMPTPVLDGAPLNVYPWSYVDADHVTMQDDGTIVGQTMFAEDPRWPAAALFPVLTDGDSDSEEDATSATDEDGQEGSDEVGSNDTAREPASDESAAPPSEETSPTDPD